MRKLDSGVWGNFAKAIGSPRIRASMRRGPILPLVLCGSLLVTAIIVVAATAALADWQAQTRFMIAAAVLAVLVIAFVLFLIIRQVTRQNRSRSSGWPCKSSISTPP